MELRQLRFFTLVAEFESFSRASAEANIAQPALSRHIKSLEEELGSRLFHRDGRGVKLTPDGERFYKRTKTVLRHLKRAVADIRGSQDCPRGEVTLGVPPHLGPSLIANLVEVFRSLYPDATLCVMEGFSRYIVEWLEIGRVDVGLIYDPKSYRYISTDLVFREHMFLVGPTASDLVNQPQVPLREIANLPLIVPNRPSLLLDRVDKAFARIETRTPTLLSVDSFAAIKALVRDGKGYTILSQAAIYEEIERRERAATRIVEPEITRELVVALPPKSIMTATARKLIELIQEMVRREVASGHWAGDILTDVALKPTRGVGQPAQPWPG